MTDVFIKSYSKKDGNVGVQSGFIARDAAGAIIIDKTAEVDFNLSATNIPLSYYGSADVANKIDIGNALVLPSSDYLQGVADAGVRYGSLMKAASSAEAQGLDSTGIVAAADSILLRRKRAEIRRFRPC